MCKNSQQTEFVFPVDVSAVLSQILFHLQIVVYFREALKIWKLSFFIDGQFRIKNLNTYPKAHKKCAVRLVINLRRIASLIVSRLISYMDICFLKDELW